MKNFPVTDFLSPRYWPTWLGLGIMRVMGFLPLPAVAVLGQTLGMILYALGRSRRGIALNNICLCFPEFSKSKCRQINRQQYRLIGQTLFTVTMNMWVSAKRFDRLVDITHREHYDSALHAGKNIIILAPHFIGIDVGGLVLSQERKVVSIYQYAKNRLVDEITKRGRSRYGGVLIERKEPLRTVFRLINQGNPFYYLPDQDAGRKGIFVPFFKQPASTTPALAKFAAATQATVIPCRTRIKPWGKGYEVILGEPLQNFPTGDDYADTTFMNQQIADMIREAPEQYFWVHRRFKTRPKGSQENFYDY